MERTSPTVQANHRRASNAIDRRPLRVGVIGLGVGAQHAAAYQRHAQCRVSLLCDLAEDKLQAVRSAFPESRTTTSAKEVLTHPEIDVVSIASFDDAHYNMAMTALKHGKHIFLEKPLCQTRKELQALHKAWKQHKGKLKISSNLILRAAPLYIWLKEQIANGALGTVYAVDVEYLYGRIEKITEGWRSRVKNYSGMQGGGVHMVDMLLWLTGQKPSSVRTWGNRIATKGTAFRYNDFMTATLAYRSGMVARVTANFGCMHRHQHVVRIYGTKGTFLYDDAGARLHTSRDPASPATPITLAPKATAKGDLIGGFVDAIWNNTSLNAETQSHFDVASILIASDESLKAQKTQEIPYL